VDLTDAGHDAATASGGHDAVAPDAASPDALAADAAIPDAAVADAALPDAAPPLPHFSFFVTSLRALQELSGSEQGFGGDLRFGETGPGAGLRGADAICAAIAERSMPGAGHKPWRAFLSATDGGDGHPVNAIDRVGEGPWYDRLGRLVANSRDDLLNTRPNGSDPAIRDDLPNEDGVPNHRPDPTRPEADNHDTLTGSDAMGQLYGPGATCLDWTANAGDVATEGRPHCGHSWPRYMGPGGRPPPGGGMGGFGDPAHWISALDESGCAPGVNIIEMGPPMRDAVTVGSGGGYGGFYCFSLEP
jgi:hypothetical protein